MSALGKTIEWREDHPPSAGHPPNGAAGVPAHGVGSHAGVKPAYYFRWKAPLDRCAAAVLLVPGLLLIILLVALVRLTSKGPGIYRQARVGKDGRRFMMYKIRTMQHDAEVSTGPIWTQPRDRRVTPVGRLLRRLHLDELPQLFNVIKGEMALVGPRPERPEFVCVLAEAVPGYRNRLAVLPGITGLAQINLPPDTDLVSVQRKIVLDCEYIERGGPWLDTRLMLCTFLRLFKLPEGWLHSLFALSRDPKVSCPLKTEPAEAPGAPGHPPGHPLAGRGSGHGSWAGESPAEPEAATPASILLQLASLPDPAAPRHRRCTRSRVAAQWKRRRAPRRGGQTVRQAIGARQTAVEEHRSKTADLGD